MNNYEVYYEGVAFVAAKNEEDAKLHVNKFLKEIDGEHKIKEVRND